MDDGISCFFYVNVEAIPNFLVYTPVTRELLTRNINNVEYQII